MSNPTSVSDAPAKTRRTRGPGKIDGEAAFSVNRDRVIRIAAALFARNGYHATGIAELCEATDLSRGSLYYYIDGKETLLYEICKTQVVRMNEQAKLIVASHADPDEKLRHLARSLLQNIADHRDEWSVFFKEFGSLEEARRVEITAARDAYENYWLEVIRQHSIAGSGALPPALVVKGLLGMFNYTYLWFRPRGRLTPEQLADAFTSIVLDGLHHGKGA